MTEISSEFADRIIINNAVHNIGQNFDVLFRKSDARGPFNLPFMKFVQNITESEYTHAALLITMKDYDFPFVLEITDVGCMFYRFIDWFNFCIDEQFALYRFNGTLKRTEEMKNKVTEIIANDPSYDYCFNDPDKYYCTESVAAIYKAGGIDLMKPKTIKQLCKTKTQYAMIAIGNFFYKKITKGKVYLDLNESFYYVGNPTNGGLMASDNLVKVYEHKP
jgi:hypothetical protein